MELLWCGKMLTIWWVNNAYLFNNMRVNSFKNTHWDSPSDEHILRWADKFDMLASSTKEEKHKCLPTFTVHLKKKCLCLDAIVLIKV